MPTTNPVPSTDPSDLLFNAGKLDEVVNGAANSFTDRLGVERRTVAGMNADFDAQLADAESDLNVYRADAAASAAEALGYLQTIRATSYGAYASDPATDPLGNPPTEGDEYWNTTAKLLKRWNGTTWQASDINTANLAAPSGSSLVGYDGGTVQDVLDGAKSLQDYAALRSYTGRAKRVYITGLLVTAKPAGVAGHFQHDPTDTTSLDNGGTIIVGADGRRWKRDYSGKVSIGWFDVRGDGSDEVAKIQTALNNCVGKTLVFGPGEYRISFKPDSAPTYGMGLDVPSNITIEFEPGASIKPLAHNHTIYQVFRIWERSNVTLRFPNIDGNKAQNSAVGGESGMGIDIRGGSNITVINPTTNNCWGDGIYIDYAVSAGPTYSHTKNCYILNPKADGCRRQGMSVISADGLVVENPVWSNIAGALPSAGIDIEPNDNNAELKGIRIINPKTINCVKGVLVYLGAFAGPTEKIVDIEIQCHEDNDSIIACAIDGLDTSSGSYKVHGSVSIIDPVWSNTKRAAFASFNWDVLGPSVHVVRPKVVNSNRYGENAPLYGSPFVVGRDAGDSRTYNTGNVIIENPSVSLTSGAIPKLFAFQDGSVSLPSAATRVQKVFFKNPVRLSGLTDAQKYGLFRGQGNISDDFDVWSVTLVGSATLSDFTVSPYRAENASTAQILGSGYFNANGPDLIFKNPFASSFIVQTDTGGNFVGMTTGQRLQSFGADAPGSYLRLKPLGSNRYLILDRLGIWNTI